MDEKPSKAKIAIFIAALLIVAGLLSWSLYVSLQVRPIEDSFGSDFVEDEDEEEVFDSEVLISTPVALPKTNPSRP